MGESRQDCNMDDCGGSLGKDVGDDDDVVTVTAKFWYVNDLDKDPHEVVREYMRAQEETFRNSKIPIKLKKWGKIERLPKSTSEIAGDSEKFLNALGRNMRSYQRLKQTADIIVLISNAFPADSECYIYSPDTPGYRDVLDGEYRTATVLSTDDPALFVHEIGHCLGGHHNREAHPGSFGQNTYHHGYCLPGVNAATVMAYEKDCPRQRGQMAERILYYSSPSVYYKGVATGDARSNNARKITERRYYVRDSGSNCRDGNSRNLCRWTGWSSWSEWGQCCCPDEYKKNPHGPWRPECAQRVPNSNPALISWAFRGNKRRRTMTRMCKNQLGEEMKMDRYVKSSSRAEAYWGFCGSRYDNEDTKMEEEDCSCGNRNRGWN